MPVSLLGMPAAGKSNLGQQLASEWGVLHVDLDRLIEDHIGQTIRQFWEIYGERQFRSLERFALLQQFVKEPAVISTGGGTPAFMDNMDMIHRFSFSIWLKTPLHILSTRILTSSRPVFKKDTDIEVQLLNLQKKRYPFYERSSFVLDMDFHEPMALQNVTSYCIQKGIITE